MAKIPQIVAYSETSQYASQAGLPLITTGKVRHTHTIPKNMIGRDDALLVIATDRASVSDFVLPCRIPQKGAVLTAMTHFWLTKFFSDIPNHLISLPGQSEMNAVHALKTKNVLPDLDLSRCLVVQKVTIESTEFIFRPHIGGSVFGQYLKDGTAGGHKLPPNLPKWSRLDEPIFTPSTKAKTGHDVNYIANEFYARTGEAGLQAVITLQRMVERAYDLLISKGIALLDTKFECQLDPFILGDEALTPDSSRMSPVGDVLLALTQKRDPIFMDKQYMRDYCWNLKTPFGLNFKELDPENEEHVVWAHSLEFPFEVVQKTTQIYLDICARVCGKPLHVYQHQNMGIN